MPGLYLPSMIKGGAWEDCGPAEAVLSRADQSRMFVGRTPGRRATGSLLLMGESEQQTSLPPRGPSLSLVTFFK